MNITAETVKQLRERTGAGMMECKKALVETQGDLDAAAELMRKSGLAKADKKAARVAAEGAVYRSSATARARCWSRSIARRTSSREATNSRPSPRDLARAALGEAPRIRSRPCSDREAARQASRSGAGRLIAKIGENISVRRFAQASLRRGRSAPTSTAGESARWSPSRAATSRWPATWPCTSRRRIPPTSMPSEVPAAVLDKEREILTEQTKGEKKPPEIIAKMVEGRLRKTWRKSRCSGSPS